MKGTYTIILECSSECYCRIGSLGRARLHKGHYLYTGSALGLGSTSLERRLERHAKRSKKKRWHIDYLTSNPVCRVKGAVYIASSRRLECKINVSISKGLNLPPLLPGIGASDCNCEGHLLGPDVRSSKKVLLKRVASIYSRVGGTHSSTEVWLA